MIDPTKLTAAMTASGGRWRVTSDRYRECFAVLDESGLLIASGISRGKADAIVAVHNSVPDLLDEIKRLADPAPSGSAEAAVERVRALHDGSYGGACIACGGWNPCATLRALDVTVIANPSDGRL